MKRIIKGRITNQNKIMNIVHDKIVVLDSNDLSCDDLDSKIAAFPYVFYDNGGMLQQVKARHGVVSLPNVKVHAPLPASASDETGVKP